jgi:hypothetical protein
MPEQDTSRPEAASAGGTPRDDDRNEEVGDSPVPDPEATDADAADDPQAD